MNAQMWKSGSVTALLFGFKYVIFLRALACVHSSVPAAAAAPTPAVKAFLSANFQESDKIKHVTKHDTIHDETKSLTLRPGKRPALPAPWASRPHSEGQPRLWWGVDRGGLCGQLSHKNAPAI